jgi:hypothetical protein
MQHSKTGRRTFVTAATVALVAGAIAAASSSAKPLLAGSRQHRSRDRARDHGHRDPDWWRQGVTTSYSS